MIIRVQSSQGTKRVEINSHDSLELLHNKVGQAFNSSGQINKLYKKRNFEDEVYRNSNLSVAEVGLNHGEMLFMKVYGKVKETKSTKQLSQPQSNKIVEDEIDRILWKEDGRIKSEASTKSDTIFKMDNLSIEPWDEGYLKEKEIKFLSFHAYMRQQTSGVDKGKYFKFETFKASCKLNPNENKKTVYNLPSAVTLNRQKFRHVDNIMFENKEIVDRFLNFWRSSGHQRMGYLYGRYSKHLEVPLGIKTEVCAIYEPPQFTKVDGLDFDVDPHENVANKIAEKIGLKKIGWIITDLVALDSQSGKVKNFRNSESHFLSAEECISAGVLQNLNPNPCRLSSDGVYGSKFVTVVASGDKENNINFEGYQVSNQCMSLVADGCLIPTLDAPELGYIRESSSELFVADVYFKEKDKYGNEVQKLARPLPLEYLLIDVPTAFPRDPRYSCSSDIAEFPACNRDSVGQTQNLSSLSSYLRKFSEEKFVDALSDFNVLLFLAVNNMLPLLDDMDMLLEAVRTHDNEKALEWSRTCENWSTLQEIMKHTSEDMDTTSADQSSRMDEEMREAIKRSLQVQ